MLVNNATTYSRDAVIAADHPCLAGHFPGDPIVPGVLLLDSIGHILQHWKPGYRIAGIPQAKFHQLLRPGQQVVITLVEQNPHSVKFECCREKEKIASGVLHIEVRP